jgi:hypothetical protein
MINWLRRLFAPTEFDFHITNEVVDIQFNHITKTAVMVAYDPATTDTLYADLERHLAKRGYFLQIIIMPVKIERGPNAE